MTSTSSGSSVTTIKLLKARKRLLRLPSSIPELLHILSQTEKTLSEVQQSPSKSIQKSLDSISDAIFTKELMTHADINVNISVACCISEIMRILAPENPYTDDKMEDFFEMVVVIFERLSSTHGGCYTKMTNVVKTVSDNRLWVLMLKLDLVGLRLIVRLFKQFLAVADFNSSAIVLEMEKTMTMIIIESEELAPELLSLINSVVKIDERISSPVCWQLGEKVLMNYAAQHNPNFPDMGQDMSIALYDYSKMVARIRDMALESEIMETKETDPRTTSKCQETSNDCQDSSRRTVKVLDIDSEDNKEHVKKLHALPDDPPKSLTKLKGKRKNYDSPWRKQSQSVEHGESLVGSRIKVWWPGDKMYYSGVVGCFDSENKQHKVLYDDGDEELLNLKHERWKLFDHETKETVPCTIDKCQETLNDCQEPSRRTVKVLDIDSEDNKEHVKKLHALPDDPPKSLTKLKGKRKNYDSPWRKQSQSVEHGESLVGSRIKVWWPGDKMYYSGVVGCFDSENKQHKVLYDDGDEELLNLKHERWKLFDHETKETVPCTTDKCQETLNDCQEPSRRTVKVLDIDSEDNKEHVKKLHALPDDPPKSLTKLKGKRKNYDSPWRKQSQSVEHGESLVGSKIKVWWPADKMYYSGVVESFDSKNKQHKVLYDDGDEELLNLKHERWKLFDRASVEENRRKRNKITTGSSK